MATKPSAKAKTPVSKLTVEACDKHIRDYHAKGNTTAVDNWLDIRLEVMAGSDLLYAAPTVTKQKVISN